MKFSLVPAVAFLVATFSGVHAQNISQTNTQCLCTNAALQQAALTCLQQSCTAQDLQNAESLVQSECAGESAQSHYISLCVHIPSRVSLPIASPTLVPVRSARLVCCRGSACQAHTLSAFLLVGGCSVVIPPSCFDSVMPRLSTESIIITSRSYGLVAGRMATPIRRARRHSWKSLLPLLFASGSGSGSGAGSATATSPAASQTQTQSQSQNAAAPTAFAKAKVGAAVVAVAVGAIVGL
ncbi:hypothetical protein V8D89_001387 [Ganoderma adspersum]